MVDASVGSEVLPRVSTPSKPLEFGPGLTELGMVRS